MPIIDGVDTKPEDAVANGRCPECGRSMAQSDAATEIRLHWPRGLDPTLASAEAISRAKLLTKHFTPAPKSPTE